MKIVKLVLVVFVLLLLTVASFFVFGSYSDGYRSGRIMKLSHKGFLFKTYEGQLDIGGLESGGDDGAATTVWSFSVKDEDVVAQINNAVDNERTVKLHYHEKYFTFFVWGDTKYFIDRVEVVNDSHSRSLNEHQQVPTIEE